MQLSEKGAAFIARHEGFVSKAYRDPTGTWTIGTGFTWGSRVFRDYWLKTRGHRLRAGDTISETENATLLRRAADEEYGAAVLRDIGPVHQHEYDGATSVCFNCGPGAAKWSWAKLLAARDVKGAAARLRVTATTSKGRKLRGLVTRRAEEADLIEHGVYAFRLALRAEKVATKFNTHVRDYQQKLKKLGYDPGESDGVYGAKTRTAVLRYQQDHADLVNDGILGRATMAQIDRSIAKRSELVKAGGAVVAAGSAAATAAASQAPDWLPWAIGAGVALLVVAAAVLLWKYRRDL